jgi:hypothetical protein
MGPTPLEPKSGSRFMTEAKRIPQYVPSAILFPYGKMGQSASGIECDLSGGKFGPFAKQLFIGDQTHSTMMRVFLEKINGRYQGACFPFRQGFGSGNVPVRFGSDGSLIVVSTNRGWPNRRSQPRRALDFLSELLRGIPVALTCPANSPRARKPFDIAHPVIP